MALHFEIQENKILLFGDTFSVKEQIKKMGGRWNSSEKHWHLHHSEENIDFLKTIGFQASLQASTLPSIDQPNSGVGVSAEKVFLKISEFVQIIGSVIKTNLNKQYWIYGEISSLKTANGNVFFDLIEKDETITNSGLSLKAASLSCVLWAGKKKLLQDKLNDIPFADGTQIKIRVGVDFRKEGARVVAIVDDLDTEHTKGNLLLQRQAIVQELKKRNLYLKNKSTVLAALPLRVALITAHNSRACADFLDELKLSQLSFQISLFDCNMQGENTSDNVSGAFKMIAENYSGHFDCIVMTRGGGSKLDLRWFDDMEICKQIAYCRLPVITAVGHFDDICIADEVSFRSEKTPTAAARFLISTVQESLSILFSRVDNIGRILLKRFEKEGQALSLLEQRIAFNAKRRLQSEAKNIERIEQFLKIFSSSIEKTMQRGFSLVYDSNGQILTGKDFTQEHFPKELNLEFCLNSNSEQKRIFVKATATNVIIKDE